MQRIKGKFSNLDDLIIFIDRLKESGGQLKLYLPYYNNLSICSDKENFYLTTSTSELPERKALKAFLEKWLISKVNPEFEFYEGEICTEGIPISKDELFQILRDPFIESVDELPPFFEITKIDVKKVPSFLVAHWTAKQPVKRDEVYRYGLTLSDILKYIEADLIEIKPFNVMESFPYKLRIFLQALALLVIAYYALPIGYLKFNQVKILEAFNWGIKEKIVKGTVREELPVKGCFKTKFYLIGNTVVNPGIDGTVGTGDDLKVELPKKGYRPTFAIPVK